MGELQILAAAVDVEVLPKKRAAHGRALDVPPGAALAPWRRPFRLLGLGALPENEIERIVLGGVDFDALAGTQLVERFSRELAVARKAAHGEIDIARGRLVGEALFF